jgi:CRP-like cAMP-binding protein
MEEIIKSLHKLSPLDDKASMDFKNALCIKVFTKGSFIIKEEMICRHFYFIQQGLIKLYSFKQDKEFIQKFFVEDMVYTEPNSYLNQRPTLYMAIALEDTVTYTISKNDIDNLCLKHHSIERLFSKIYQQAMLEMMDRISEMMEEDASARYHKFTRERHYLLQRITLGDLAGYIGITQGSLSRIRAQKL